MSTSYEAGREHDLLPLEVLLNLARSASEDPLEDVLQTVAETILKTAGYKTVVLSLYRPEWDDYQVAIVVGDEQSRRVLEGSSTPREVMLRLLDAADRRLGSAHLFTSDRSAIWDELSAVYIPKLEPADHEDAWLPEDALVVMLSDTGDEPLGFASIDEPVSGRRPSDEELKLVTAICSFAEQALRMARRVATAEQDTRLLAELSEISPVLSACVTIEQLQALLFDTLRSQFGFRRAAGYRRDLSGALSVSMSRGWNPTPPRLAVGWSWLQEQLRGRETTGPQTLLLDAGRLYAGRPPEDLRDAKDHGPRAWHHHCLVVPWGSDNDEIAGVLVLQDPASRLLPTQERRRAISVLVDLAASVATGIEQRETLNRLATHDSLTGVRNRRGLDMLEAERGPVAVLLCDIDHFKRINDRFGHHTGDRVLARFGELLREHAGVDDVPIRLGGEEFCVLLPNTDIDGACIAAERLRKAVKSWLAAVVPGGATLSIGVVASDADRINLQALLRSADGALYQAKQSGRNRVVVAAPDGNVQAMT